MEEMTAKADEATIRGTAEKLVALLLAHGLSIATAESCTGGLLAGALTDVSGVSACFPGGIVSYANRIKNGMLGVPDKILESVGAVSPECGGAMAEGVRKRFGVSIGLSTTGIAGPTGGTETKPVGLVYVSVSTPDETRVTRNLFEGDRETVRRQSVRKALDLAIEILTEDR